MEGSTPEDPIDLTKDDEDDDNTDNKSKEDKGKGKADVDNDNDDPNLLEYFYKLLDKRKELINQYEEASRAYNKSETEENKSKHDKIVDLLEENEQDIETMKDNGFLDPADDIQSEDE